MDVVAGANQQHGISIMLRNNDQTGFEDKRSFLIVSSPPALAVADFNGDGLDDVLSGTSAEASPKVLIGESLLSEGSHSLTKTTVAELRGRPFGLNDIQAADLNGDGHPDMVVVGVGFVYVLLN